MKRLLLSALSIGVLLQPVQLDAQQPYFFDGIPDATEYMDFLGGSGVNGGYGVQVGPYLARFTTPLSPQFSIYCVDYTHYARDQWVAVSGLAPAADLSRTRLNDYAKYRQAAYLSSLFDTAPTSTWGGIHAAIWSITSGVTVGTQADRDYYLGLAVPTSFTAAGWYVLSSSQDPLYPGRDGQEFLMRTRVSVPEPAGFLLMATGLIMLAAVGRKRLSGLQEGDA
jgi:hypothetical protein